MEHIQKFMISFCIIMCLFSAASVCASDVNDTVTVNYSDDVVTTDDIIVVDHNESSVSEHDNEATGSFTELQKLIDKDDTINLTKDYTVTGSEGRIIITSDKIINGNGHTLSGKGISGIFAINGGINVIINDIILRDGSDRNGGAISAYGNVNGLTFSNVSFLNNQAVDSGGAVYINGDNLAVPTKFINCNFENNIALNLFGGALYYKSIAPLLVSNCNFENNLANDYYYGMGGAIFSRTHTEINKSKFLGNTAFNFGGAIYADNTLAVANCEFYDNHVENNGGAIFADQALNIYDCEFLKNTAKAYGGAVYSIAPYEYNTLIVRSVFNCNSAEEDNGGAVKSITTVIIEDCEFNNNNAGSYGGAIYADNDMQFRGENTFIGNIAENDGGAVYTGTILGNVEYVTFKSNQVKKNDGGAIYINNEYDGTFTHCFFEKNYAHCDGGAIYINSMSSDVTLTKNAFIGNNARYGKSAYTCNRGGIWGETAFNLGPNWYGDTDETSFQNQFYRSLAIRLLPGDCVEYKVETWLNSVWEMFNDD